MSNSTLSDAEQSVYRYLQTRGIGRDVSIVDLHSVLHRDTVVARIAQQRVGAVVSKINRKISGYEIVPGREKRTYRLIALPK